MTRIVPFIAALFFVLLAGHLTAPPASAQVCNYVMNVHVQDRHDGLVTELHELSSFGVSFASLHVKDKAWNFTLGLGPEKVVYDIGPGQARHPDPYHWQWATGFNIGGGEVRVKGKAWGVFADGSMCENFVVDAEDGIVGGQAEVPRLNVFAFDRDGLYFEPIVEERG